MEMDPLMHFVLLTFIAFIWFFALFLWEWIKKTPFYEAIHKVVFKLMRR